MRAAVATIGVVGALGLAAAQAQAPPAEGGVQMVAGSRVGSPGPDTLIGGPGPVDLRGGAGADSLQGAEGPDTLNGNGGADTVDGAAGADSLFGGRDADSLAGGLGDDLLSGDRGDDSLSGGEGADLFVFEVGSGADTVADFSAADGDRIRLPDGIEPTVSEAGGDLVLAFGTDRIRLTGVTPGTLGTWRYAAPAPAPAPAAATAPARDVRVGYILLAALVVAFVTFVIMAARALKERRS